VAINVTKGQISNGTISTKKNCHKKYYSCKSFKVLLKVSGLHKSANFGGYAAILSILGATLLYYDRVSSDGGDGVSSDGGNRVLYDGIISNGGDGVLYCFLQHGRQKFKKDRL